MRKKCGEFWNESCWGCNQFHSIDQAACLECPITPVVLTV